MDVFEHHPQRDRVERFPRHCRVRQRPLDDLEAVLRPGHRGRVRAEVHADRVPAAFAHLGGECPGATAVIEQLPAGRHGNAIGQGSLAATDHCVAQVSQDAAPSAPRRLVGGVVGRIEQADRGLVRARIEEDERARPAAAEPIFAAVIPGGAEELVLLSTAAEGARDGLPVDRFGRHEPRCAQRLQPGRRPVHSVSAWGIAAKKHKRHKSGSTPLCLCAISRESSVLSPPRRRGPRPGGIGNSPDRCD